MTVPNVTTETLITSTWGNAVTDAVNDATDDLTAATAAATAAELIRRDGAGRAKVVTPADDADIANKGYADALGTAAVTADTIMRRDANGRAKVANPSAATDIANKQYVDGLLVAGWTAVGSLSNGWSGSVYHRQIGNMVFVYAWLNGTSASNVGICTLPAAPGITTQATSTIGTGGSATAGIAFIGTNGVLSHSFGNASVIFQLFFIVP